MLAERLKHFVENWRAHFSLLRRQLRTQATLNLGLQGFCAQSIGHKWLNIQSVSVSVHPECPKLQGARHTRREASK